MSFASVLERLSKLENPYPGLRPFETDEAHLFFGRDQQVLDLLDRLAGHRFVAVLGLSGSGKSSLIRAGLIAALNQRRLLEPGLRWLSPVIARPAGAPFASLAVALGCAESDLRASSHGLIEFARNRLGQDEGLFVVIDQFEELFRYKDGSVGSPNDPSGRAAAASEAAAFIELLLASIRSVLPVYVVVTMRTDYLGDCAEFPGFPELLNESQYLVPRLTREQRRQAIEGPLGRVRISSALVEQILNDAGDEPDQLPILQHALMRTWSRWRDAPGGTERAIGMEDYDAAGRFEGALNQHADELMGSPAALAEPKFVEIVFRRLTALGRSNRERRDPATLSDLWALCNAESDHQRREVNEILDVFRQGEATFLTPRGGNLKSDTYIDIAHESLIRNWKLLADQWLPEEEKQARTLVELLDRARDWRAGKKDLLVGLDLSGAVEWDSRRSPSPEWAEHYAGAGALSEVEEFLSASRAKSAEADQRRREQLAAERSSARRTRILSYVLAALLLIAIGFGVVAWRATRRALDQQATAESRELAAKAETLLSLGNPGDALSLAIQAFRIEATHEASEVVARAFPQELAKLEGHSDALYGAAFLPDAPLAVTVSSDHTVRVWNAATQKIMATLGVHSDPVLGAAFSADGRRVLTASGIAAPRVWDTTTGQILTQLQGTHDSIDRGTFSPDGRRLLTVGFRTARVWDATTGKLIALLDGHSETVLNAVFSPDGQQVVTAESDNTAHVWDAATGRQTAVLKGHSGLVWNAVFSPDGRKIATAGDDNTARVWDAATGREIAKLEGHSGAVHGAEFSPDGELVVTASDDRTARVWDAATGHPIARLEGHSGAVHGAQFSPDGRRIITASSDKTARIWNTSNGLCLAVLSVSSEVITAVLSPDGGRVLTVSRDNTARVWNVVAAGQVIARLEGHTSLVNSARFSPDGKRVVTASYDNTARIWNGASGELMAKLEGHTDAVNSAEFSPDGQHVVTASNDNTARIWNVVSGKLIARLEGHTDAVNRAEFSPDGQHVVTVSNDKTARIWNVLGAGLPLTLKGSSAAVVTGTFSPDGQQVVTTSYDHFVRVWNTATGQNTVTMDGRHTQRVEFLPDGKRLTTLSDDGTTHIWNASTGKPIEREDPIIAVNNTANSPDGQRVVTIEGNTTLVWNGVTGRLVAKLDGVSSAAISSDGQRAVTADGATARIFRIVTLDDIASLLASK